METRIRARELRVMCGDPKFIICTNNLGRQPTTSSIYVSSDRSGQSWQVPGQSRLLFCRVDAAPFTTFSRYMLQHLPINTSSYTA